jgi:hypothetical protein
MNRIFVVLKKKEYFIEIYHIARARPPRARADHAT